MSLSDLLVSSPPSLSEQLKRRTNEVRSRIVRANYNTQFAQTAPELADFRHATAGHVSRMDDDILSDSFQKTVHLTNHDSYAPFMAKFFDKPCKASAIVDLLAPGLPDYLAQSSSTSGGLPKFFPKYNRLAVIRSSDATSCAGSDPVRRRTVALLRCLACERMIVEDENSCPMTTIYLSSEPQVTDRTDLYLDPDEDEERMATFVLGHTTPYAVAFIKKWQSFLLIHALFAVASPLLETINVVFISNFVEMIHHLNDEFDTVVDCLASGVIPDLDGIAEVRHHLELNILADPERAAELRRIGRPSSRPGWCGHVWPNLRSVIAISSGSFSSSVPLARWFLGPNTDINSRGYRSTECFIGVPYNPRELNRFKLTNTDVIELLDISKSNSVGSLAQLWEVELGRRYEPVLTTRDGLWRYRIGDVVEISGFDPTDGVPIVQFIERRNVVMRFPDFMVTEKELRGIMASTAFNMQIKLVNWTATIDDRCVPHTIGFFIELIGDEVCDLANAPQCLVDELLRLNEVIGWALARNRIRKPTIRLVRSGAFLEFLQMKLDERSKHTGQVKVPVVLPKAAYVTWFADRVVKEL